MKVLFIAGFSPIVREPTKSQELYVDGLGLPLDERQGDYVCSGRIEGTKHFGLWPLTAAAQACFGSDVWPADLPVPQATLELEVDDVEASARSLEQAGHRLLHATKTEPWGQTIARLLSPDGLLIGICRTPWMHAPPASP